MTTAGDPRTAAVEDNLVDLLAALAGSPGLGSEGRPDVTTWSSDVPHPLFNGVAGARFPDEEVGRRAGAVLAAYVARGRPFLWWTTPSTTSAGLERLLDRFGMVRADSPGLHLPLRGARAPGARMPAARMPAARAPAAQAPPPGLELRPAGPGEEPVLAPLVLAALGMSPALLDPFTRLLTAPDPARRHRVVALAAGEAVGCGTLWVTGRTAGLYDIATLPTARGRGVGTAVTAALLEAARERGCTEVVLHASGAGIGVYRRLGFTPVCTVSQHLWVPRHAVRTDV